MISPNFIYPARWHEAQRLAAALSDYSRRQIAWSERMEYERLLRDAAIFIREEAALAHPPKRETA